MRDTGAFATIDVGHLLSYRWLRGHRDEALYENLNELPLEIVRELHLSGCSIVRGTFMDLHHGSLLDEQLHLTRLLLDATPTIRFVTYEDPKFDAAGAFVRTSRTSNDALRDVVRTETNAGVA